MWAWAAGAAGACGWVGGCEDAGEPCGGTAEAEGVGPGAGSWGAPDGAVEGAGVAPLGVCKAGGWACSICCWADESESLSLS